MVVSWDLTTQHVAYKEPYFTAGILFSVFSAGLMAYYMFLLLSAQTLHVYN